jgi:hypothetical protein
VRAVGGVHRVEGFAAAPRSLGQQHMHRHSA